MITIASIIYVIKALVTSAIFFVWVVRYQNIVEEFKLYGLPSWLRDLVGILKLSFVFMLHIPDATVVLFGSSGISLLMLPAFSLMVFCILIFSHTYMVLLERPFSKLIAFG